MYPHIFYVQHRLPDYNMIIPIPETRASCTKSQKASEPTAGWNTLLMPDAAPLEDEAPDPPEPPAALLMATDAELNWSRQVPLGVAAA